MASYNPPIFNSSIFNADAFVDEETPLTLEEANNRYLTKSYPTGFGNLNMSGSIEAYTQLKIENDINTNITSSTNASLYGIHLHHNQAQNGIKLANGIAFLNSNTDIAPGASITFNRTGTNSVGDLIFSTKSGTTCDERMRILSGGNVGIGISNPSSSLHVNGSTKSNVLAIASSTSIAGFLSGKIAFGGSGGAAFLDITLNYTNPSFFNNSPVSVLASITKTATNGDIFIVNVYSFSSTQVVFRIYRIDSLGSAWTVGSDIHYHLIYN